MELSNEESEKNKYLTNGPIYSENQRSNLPNNQSEFRNINNILLDFEKYPELFQEIVNRPNQDQFNQSASSSIIEGSKKSFCQKIKSYLANIIQPSENKLAIKLFGSKRGVLKEKIRQKKIGILIIHPCSNFRFFWDLVMLILLIANVIILPVAIAFFNDYWNYTGILVFNLVSDSLFLLDIIIKFRTGKNFITF